MELGSQGPAGDALSGVKNRSPRRLQTAQKCAVIFRASAGECADTQNHVSNTVMTTATLRTMVRDPRSGEVHLPSERVAIESYAQPRSHFGEGDMAGRG